MSTYIRSYANDFGSKFDSTQFKDEIVASSNILKTLIALNKGSPTPDTIKITFDEELSNAEQIALNTLIANHIPKPFIGSTLSFFDALVANDGSGDHLLPSAAFASGAKTVLIRSGIYFENADIVIPDGGILCGESLMPVKIYFNGNYTIKCDANKGNIYNIGTISIEHGSKNILGSGTIFTQMGDANMISISKAYYEIETINTNTSLTLKFPYYGRTVQGISYIAQKMYSGINVSNLFIAGAGYIGMLLRGLNKSNIHNCTFCHNNHAIELYDSFSITVEDVNISNQISDGIIFSNCYEISVVEGIVHNNGGCGYKVIGNDSCIVFNGTSAVNNALCGFNIGGDAENITIADSTIRNNNVRGITLTNNATNIIIDSNIISFNNNFGIYNEVEEVLITSNLICNNVGSGINLTNTANDNLISDNIINKNSTNGIVIGSNDCIISNNSCKGNGAIGLLINTGSTDCKVDNNLLKGNIGLDFVNNGN